METQQEVHKARPPVLPSCTCRKTITPHPPPLLGWRILFGPVSAAVRIKARGWEGKVWEAVAPLFRPGIYLRLWHSKSGVTASRPGGEADSLCCNKEQRTETEWEKGSHSLCGQRCDLSIQPEWPRLLWIWKTLQMWFLFVGTNLSRGGGKILSWTKKNHKKNAEHNKELS